MVEFLGYSNNDRASKISIKYMEWYGHINSANVHHRNSPEGEKRITVVTDEIDPRTLQPIVRNYKLDGFVVREGQKDLAIEFLGCFYHGCPICFPFDSLLSCNKSAGELYEKTLKRLNHIRSAGLEVKVVWECEITKKLKTNKRMKEFMDSLIDLSPLDPRLGLHGGRVEKHCSYYKPKEDEELAYYDVNSLYPSVLKKPYYIGFTIYNV